MLGIDCLHMPGKRYVGRMSWYMGNDCIAWSCMSSLEACLPTDDGCCSCQVSIVNSSWTANHIRQLWWRIGSPICVFPPCNTDAFQRLPLDRKLKRLYLVSVAQFRPEKNHELQLRAFAQARQWAAQESTDGHPGKQRGFLMHTDG